MRSAVSAQTRVIPPSTPVSRPGRNGNRRDGVRRLRMLLAGLFVAGLLVSGCAEEEAEFPDQIPAIKATLGEVLRAVNQRDPRLLDSVSSDRELYADLAHIVGPDSLVVLTRRINNPIDSAHVILRVAPASPAGETGDYEYELEIFMRRQGERFWIVAHRLKSVASLP